MKALFYPLLCACLLAAPACSSKKDDPAAAASLPELTAVSGGMVAYVNGTSTTFTAVSASIESDASESRYYVGGTMPNGTKLTAKFIVPAGQPLPSAKEQDMVLFTYTPVPGTSVPNVYGTGHGVLTVSQVAGQPSGRNFTGSFRGTVNGYTVEGGKFKDVIRP